jgi:hypothetical protein
MKSVDDDEWSVIAQVKRTPILKKVSRGLEMRLRMLPPRSLEITPKYLRDKGNLRDC